MLADDVSIRNLLQTAIISRLDNRILLGMVTGFNHAQLIARDDYKLNNEQLMHYRNYLERAISGEPIAYIIGYREFYSRLFRVTPDTLIPRPETEILVSKVIELAKPKAKIIDLGTGSGCIAISCKLERSDLQVCAIDKFEEALTIARHNAATLNAEIEFLQNDWLSGITRRFDVVVSNPPYIEANDEHLKNLQFEPQTALTDFGNGLSCIELIVQQSYELLDNNGWLLIEHGYNQSQAVQRLFEANNFICITTLKDYAGLDRITMGQKK